MTTTTNRNRWSLVCAVVGLLLPSAGLAQTTLSVICVGPGGAPVRGAKVTLQAMRSPKPAEKKTNKAGLANFKKVEDGVYRIWARAEGMAPALHDLWWLRSTNGVTQNVKLTMKAGNSVQRLYFEDSSVLNRASQLIQSAVSDFGTENLEAAETKLKEAIELFPSSPLAHRNLGLLDLHLARWEEGQQHLQQAADYMEIFGMLGDSQYAQTRQEALSTIQTIPLQKLAVEANALMTDRNYKNALSKFEEMRRMVPDNPDVYYNMALARAHANLVPGAKEAIGKALELRPSDAAFAKLRDQILQIEKTGESLRTKEIVDGLQRLYAAEEYQAVVDRLKEALKEIPEDSQHPLWRLLGQAQMKAAQYSDSIMSYQKASKLNAEKEVEILRELAENLLDNEQYDHAFEIYGEYYAAASQPAAQGFYELGTQLSNQGKGDLAGSLFQKVLEINPDHVDAHYSLGMHYFYDKHDRENAKKFLEHYLEISEDATKLDNAKSVLVVMEKTP